MRYLTVIVIMTGALLTACDGAPGDTTSDSPILSWELSGFENPESALPDPKAGVIYVSNVAGEPTDKDGNGFISKVSLDGKLTAGKWVTGLDGPKGMTIAGDKLYVSDIDKLVEIDVKSATIVAKYDAPGAKFLNDAAADSAGNIYVSDLLTNTIWRLSNGTFEAWLKSDALSNPNGLYVDGSNLIVGAWGKMTDGFATKIPGHLLKVSLADKTVASLGSGAPVGNLDGVAALDDETFLASDWLAGKIYMISRGGKSDEILNLGQGTADLAYDPASKTAYIPLMKEGKLKAYRID